MLTELYDLLWPLKFKVKVYMLKICVLLMLSIIESLHSNVKAQLNLMKMLIPGYKSYLSWPLSVFIVSNSGKTQQNQNPETGNLSKKPSLTFILHHLNWYFSYSFHGGIKKGFVRICS